MTNLEALRALQELFADPARHTRLYQARDGQGLPCSPESPNATCWCLSGGIDKIATERVELSDALYRTLSRASWARNAAGIVHTNDHLGLDAVRLVIADAITQELSHAD